MAEIQQTLEDFKATVSAKPNLSDKELLSKFPEFSGSNEKLQSAKDYVATQNSGKYKSQAEINSKFPEFFGETKKQSNYTPANPSALAENDKYMRTGIDEKPKYLKFDKGQDQQKKSSKVQKPSAPYTAPIFGLMPPKEGPESLKPSITPETALVPKDYYKEHPITEHKPKPYENELTAEGFKNDVKEGAKGIWEVASNLPGQLESGIEGVGAGTLNAYNKFARTIDEMTPEAVKPYMGSQNVTVNLENSLKYHVEKLKKDNDAYKGKSLEDLAKEDNYTGVVGKLTQDAVASLPEMGLFMVYPIAGAGTIGILGGVDKYDQLEPSKDMTETQKRINAATTGISGALGIYLLGGAQEYLGGVAKSIEKEGVDATKKLLTDQLGNWAKQIYQKAGVASEGVLMGTQSAMNKVADNTIDYATGATKEYKPLDGFGTSFFSGAGTGVLMDTVGHVLKPKSENPFDIERKKATDELTEKANKDTNNIQTVKLKSGEEVQLTGGKIAFDEEGNFDKQNSDNTIYYKDDQGKNIMAPSEHIESKISDIPLDQAHQVAISQIDHAELTSFLPVEGGELHEVDGGLIVTKFDPETNQIQFAYADENGNVNTEFSPLTDQEYADISGKPIPEFLNYQIEEENATQERNIKQNDLTEHQNGNETRTPAETSSSNEPESIGQVQEEVKPKTFLEQIPTSEVTDAKGNVSTVPNFESAPIETTIGALNEAFETPEEVNSVIDSKIETINKQIAKLDKFKPSGDIVADIKKKAEIKQQKADLQTQSEYWDNVKKSNTPKVEEQIPQSDSNKDYYEITSKTSNNIADIKNAYDMAMSETGTETLMPWQQELLGMKIHPTSFNKLGDRNYIPDVKSWLTSQKEPLTPNNAIDTIAENLSELGTEVTPQMIVDFMLDHPQNKIKNGNEHTQALNDRFKEVSSKISGKKIGGIDSPSGDTFLKTHEGLSKVNVNMDDVQNHMNNEHLKELKAVIPEVESEAYFDDFVRQKFGLDDATDNMDIDRKEINKIKKKCLPLPKGGFKL